jgi:hypothetical protein
MIAEASCFGYLEITFCLCLAHTNPYSMISHLLAGLAAFSVARASPHALSRRGTVASDEIVGLPQTVPSGTIGEVYLAYQPDLYVVNGCVSFPGVDAAGNTKLVAFLLFYSSSCGSNGV